MISKLLYAFEHGIGYVRAHPQLLFSLFLVVLLPLAFLYSSNQFLAVGQANQDRLQKDKIGLLHDAFFSIMRATDYNVPIMQEEINQIIFLNPDVKKFRVAKSAVGSTDVVVVAAFETDHIGTVETEATLYRTALTRPEESIIIPFMVDGERTWQSFRASFRNTGEIYYVFTETDLSSIDRLFAQRKQSAYLTLFILYVFLLGLAYWLTRITDYRYLYKEAEKANQMKDLFTNMIAHELRAPLTAIKGYAGMIESDAETEESKKYSSRVRLSAERLLDIVNDLLDVARIQSGKLKVELNNVAIVPEIHMVLDELKVTAEEKSIALTVDAENDLVHAHVDAKRFHQALTNLISNAIKYTKEGKITVGVTEGVREIELRVQDTGMGISAEDQDQLFAPFFRVASDDVSQITGTGLGMWITRQMIELMGGSIAVESIKGVGTHVVVKLKKPTKKGL